jgi:hypothetical protein
MEYGVLKDDVQEFPCLEESLVLDDVRMLNVGQRDRMYSMWAHTFKFLSRSISDWSGRC